MNVLEKEIKLSCYLYTKLKKIVKVEQSTFKTSLPGKISEWEPPESIPNSEVKTLSADDSVGEPM